MKRISYKFFDPCEEARRIRAIMSMHVQTKKFKVSPSEHIRGKWVESSGSKGKSQSLSVDYSEDISRWVTDLELIKKQKDVDAFERLFNHFAPKVKGFLIKSGSDAALAEECVQEVMATLWNKAHLFDPTRASVSTWIFTIARNKRIDAIRKQKRPEPEDLGWGPEHEPDQEDVLGLQQDTERLGHAIAALPEKQRNLLERAYFKDMSHSEIAAATGLPLGTIKSRIRLALERLRHAMK